MRSCSNGVFKRSGQIGRPCLLGYIDKCSAPCVGTISAEDHRAIVDDFCDFMAGHTNAFVKRIRARDVRRLRGRSTSSAPRGCATTSARIEKALEKQAVVLGDGTDADVIALAEDPLEVAVQIFYVRGGRIRGQRGWVADRVDEGGTPSWSSSSSSSCTPAATTRRRRPARDPGAGAAARAEVFEELLVASGGEAGSRIRVPQRGDKRTLQETVARNAGQALMMHKTKRGTDLTARNQALEEIQQALGLDEAPLRIECYDISNLQGTEVVASMVVFEDGLPARASTAGS